METLAWMPWYALVGFMMAAGMLLDTDQDEESRAQSRQQFRAALRAAPWLAFLVAIITMLFWLPFLAHSLLQRLLKKPGETAPRAWRPRPVAPPPPAPYLGPSPEDLERTFEQIRHASFQEGYATAKAEHLKIVQEIVIQGDTVSATVVHAQKTRPERTPSVQTGT